MPNTIAMRTRRLKLTLIKKRFDRVFTTGLLVSLAVFASARNGAAAGVAELSERDPMIGKLAAPMKAIVDGVAFRDAVRQVSEPIGVNVWISRQVDPSAKVELGPLGPTGFAAIEQLAASRGCVAHWVGQVVVIGPAAWVDSTSAAVMNVPSKPDNVGDVNWPALSTPDEALAAAGVTTKSSPSLPYDLWPAVTWTQIDRTVAGELIRRQFDQPPSSATVVRRYRGENIESVRAAIRDGDSKAKVRVVDGALEVRASATAHRLAAAAMMRQPRSKSAAEPTFSLKSTTSARNALNQLCAAAGRKCVIEDSAVQACEKEVTIEAKDISLREIIDGVAQKVGLRTTWTDSEVRVSQ